MKKHKHNFFYKVREKGQVVQIVETHSKTRFMNKARSINWKNRPLVYLRVNYGKKENNKGQLVSFYNDGVYGNYSDFNQAFKAFFE